jgi:hypothetical protein
VENFGWNFSANLYSEPECSALSSSAMVTAARKVHAASRDGATGSTTKVIPKSAKHSEELRSVSFVSFVVKVVKVRTLTIRIAVWT